MVNPRCGHRHAITLAVALFLTIPFAAHGQGVSQIGKTTGSSAAPAAAAPATPIPPDDAAQPAAGSAAPAASAPAVAAAPAATPAPAPAAAALPGEHMISGADLPEDLSPWGMFENSDLVVKAFARVSDHRRKGSGSAPSAPASSLRVARTVGIGAASSKSTAARRKAVSGSGSG